MTSFWKSENYSLKINIIITYLFYSLMAIIGISLQPDELSKFGLLIIHTILTVAITSFFIYLVFKYPSQIDYYLQFFSLSHIIIFTELLLNTKDFLSFAFLY